MKLSIALAGIRTQNWLALYQSIRNSTSLPKEEYELVIVSPYDLPLELQNVDNVRLVKDKGCPTRCYQLGLLHSKGEYVVWIADDGMFSPTLAVDKAFNVLPKRNGIVAFKYHEGENSRNNRIQSSDRHYRLGTIGFIKRMKSLRRTTDYTLVMIGLMSREYLMELGGWNCRFEQPGMACVDSSIRWQDCGANVVLGEMCLDLTHVRAGVDSWGVDHMPIEDAHFQNDWPLFQKIYKHSSRGVKIDVNNWQDSPNVWPRRKFE